MSPPNVVCVFWYAQKGIDLLAKDTAIEPQRKELIRQALEQRISKLKAM